MCKEILVIHGDERIDCETVGDLAKALHKQPIEVSSVEDKKSCLCHARIEEIGARRATEEEYLNGWPEYVIEIQS